MTIKPIRNDSELDGAMARIDELLDCLPGTPETDELEVLSILVEAYEDEHHPVPPPAPIDAIRFIMDQRNLKAKDLIDVFGSSGRTSEVLSGRRALTLPMIRKLHQNYGLPAESLIAEYDLQKTG